MSDLKELLDYHAELKNCDENLFAKPDPLQVARRYNDPLIALICALFSYGNAANIVKFLNSLDFSLLNLSEETIRKTLTTHKYRFQSLRDVAEIFVTFRRLKESFSIEEAVLEGFSKEGKMVDGIATLIEKIEQLNSYSSDGYSFFFGKSFDKKPKSPYKRYNMYLRWMVRSSDIDMGLFKKLDKKDLLIPLDVHTHKTSLALGLMSRKTYDFDAVLELTNALRSYDMADPIRYDFALYRLGQSKEIESLLKNGTLKAQI